MKRDCGFGFLQIAQERSRQLVDEHFTEAHDDTHTDCSLIQAAQTYAEAARRQVLGGDTEEVAAVGQYWPWSAEWLKVDADPVRNLVKAGALIAAEIDRLQRRDAHKPADSCGKVATHWPGCQRMRYGCGSDPCPWHPCDCKKGAA